MPGPGNRLQIGLSAAQVGGYTPYINLFKVTQQMEFFKSGDATVYRYHPDTSIFASNSAIGAGIVDTRGNLIVPVTGVTSFNAFIYNGAGGVPAGFSRTGQAWACKWDGGTATASMLGNTSSMVGGNRMEFTWGAMNNAKYIVWENIDQNNPPTNIRIFKVSNEAALDAGEIFEPDWLEQVTQAGGLYRFMDWGITNGNWSQNNFSRIPTSANKVWGGTAATNAHISIGTPISVMAELCRETSKDGWYCIPHIYGIEKVAKVTAITNATDPVLTTQGSTFQTGDKLLFYASGSGGNWESLLNTPWTVGTATSTSIQITGITTSGITSLDAYVFKTIDLNGYFASQITTLMEWWRDNFPADRVIYFELSNEGWNPGFPALAFYAAQGSFLAVPGLDNAYNAQGYIAAKVMAIANTVFGSSQRHRWKGVLPGQAASYGIREEYKDGIAKWIADNPSPAYTLVDLFDCYTVANYFNYNLRDNIDMGTVTISNGGGVSAGVVTYAPTFNSKNNQPCKFTTTGTLPAPLVAGTIYYMKNRNAQFEIPAGTFELSLTPGGASIITTSAGSGTHSWTLANGDIITQWLSTSQSRYASGLEPSEWAYYDRVANQEARDGLALGSEFAVQNVLDYWGPNHKAWADANGLEFLGYEGGNHTLLSGSFLSNADALAAYFASNHTEEDARSYRMMFDGMVVLGATYPSKFVDAGDSATTGTWGGMKYMNGDGTYDNNPVWQQCKSFNQYRSRVAPLGLRLVG